MLDKIPWLDEYKRTARLTPALLALAPAIALGIAFGIQDDPIAAWVGGFLVAVGMPLILIRYVRRRGRSAETMLNAEWTGQPTTILLRVREGDSPDALRRQRRRNLERITGEALPVLSRDDPDEANADVYEAAVNVLRTKTYDKERYPRVFDENVQYGFERNVYGVRVEGRTMAGLALLATVGYCSVAFIQELKVSWVILGAVAVLQIGFAAFWAIWPTKNRVRDSGDRYAERLLDAAADV